MVTQKLIVEKLGVSQSAVSCALSSDENVTKQISKELRNKIIREAARMNYKPRRAATKKTKSKTISLFDQQYDGSYCHPVLVKSVQSCALESSYMLNHYFYEKNIEIPDELLDSIDGIISLELISDSELERIKSRNIPLVFLNAAKVAQHYDVVMPDHYSGIRKAMNCLYDMGHRQFAFFSLRDFCAHHAERYGAFHQVISELNIATPPEIFIPFRSECTFRDVDDKVREMLKAMVSLKNMPTALICAVDSYAISAIRQAPEFGLRIPEDLSIVGFDNISECESCTPTLSSISLSLDNMGKVAASTLIRRINKCNDPFATMRVDLEWIPRDSIAAPRKQG